VNELAHRVGARLKAAGAVLATAESCTGGWVAEVVTSIAGSSSWFDRGFVTYSNEAKQEMLGVKAGTIERHGAVSEETAREMAKGALERSRATIAVSVTGIAGPTGGSDAKPVGMVCFAWATKKGERTGTQRFQGDRESVRRLSVIHALEGVLETLTRADAGHT
jgi:nicotinamide-nucleotide amidase